ncbi:MAG: uroporphyrinogen-III C-methyltransferase [Piscinibacter sp.]|uniref:uroporphyrinogen-III C-methyltransferase n=1 Tax=Piscinibacter sp. TaxID=1903157 RepID=UPI003D12E3ED
MTLLSEPLQFTPDHGIAAGPGHVTLVGAGPGDPDLLTVKAARALREATLVLYDNLVSQDVLALVPASADRVYVGKISGHHSLSQDGIIELMLRLAGGGRRLVRLKGGDPYIFGRGGEEAEALAGAGIPFDVIPGISAAQGASAATGIPLTHRDHAESLVYATGHLRGEGEARTVDLDWQLLSRPRQTVVIYMGVGTLPVISAQLQAHGLSGNTPAAIVERATQPGQRTLTGTLATLPELAKRHDVRAPALIMIGTVVLLRAELGQAAATPAVARTAAA